MWRVCVEREYGIVSELPIDGGTTSDDGNEKGTSLIVDGEKGRCGGNRYAQNAYERRTALRRCPLSNAGQPRKKAINQ